MSAVTERINQLRADCPSGTFGAEVVDLYDKTLTTLGRPYAEQFAAEILNRMADQRDRALRDLTGLPIWNGPLTQDQRIVLAPWHFKYLAAVIALPILKAANAMLAGINALLERRRNT